MTQMAFTVRSWPHTRFADEVDISVQIAVGDEPLKTRQVATLRGVECDYLNTIVGEIASSYMYGERPKDVSRAFVDVVRLAREHGAAHQP